MHPATAIAALWLIWIVSWVAAAFWADPAEKRAGFQAELGKIHGRVAAF